MPCPCKACRRRKVGPYRNPCCALCLKPRGHHAAVDMACPVGIKYRSVGYINFSMTDRYQPIQN